LATLEFILSLLFFIASCIPSGTAVGHDAPGFFRNFELQVAMRSCEQAGEWQQVPEPSEETS